MLHFLFCFIFFFNDPATTEIYTLSLHDALPICHSREVRLGVEAAQVAADLRVDARVHSLPAGDARDRKSTRLNSSHSQISYAVFCLKKKNKSNQPPAPIQRVTTSTSTLHSPAPQ